MILTICGMDNEVAAVVLPIATSILIFLGGGLANVFSDNIKRRKDIKSAMDVVIRWSGMTINSAKKQISSLTGLSKSISETKELSPKALKFQRNMADKLQYVSAERMTSLFVTNTKPKYGKKDEREKYAFNIVSQYDFLTAIQDEIRNNYEIYNNACNELIGRWNTVMVKSQHDRDNLSPLKSTGNGSVGNTKVSKEINAVFDSFLDGRDRAQESFVDLYNGIVMPLNRVVDICRTKYPKATSGNAIYEDAREMQMIHKQWSANVDGYSEVFSNIASALQQSVDSLSAAVDYFENSTKVKMWCR